MRLALIITTYNRCDALRAVLDAFCAQTDPDFELIVADDGSGDATRQLVLSYRDQFKQGLKHIWHEDRGFRAAAIRNRACLASDADYIIFTDGDCIPAVNFVAAHRALARPNCFVAGNRVLLSRSLSDRALAERLPLNQWTTLQWLGARLKGDINRLLPLFELGTDWAFRDREPHRWEGVKTCNLAVWRKDLMAVNGFDESYEGWGMEDSDFVIRLLRNGQKHRSARFITRLFHLWHQENDRSALASNEARLRRLLEHTAVRAERGIDQY